jgi:hypothetical protein
MSGIDHPASLWRMARELRAAGEVDQARMLLLEGTIQFPCHFLPAEGLADIAEVMGDWAEAEAWWRKSKSLNDAHWQSHAGVARALREQKRTDEAEELLVALVDRVSDFAEGLSVISEQVGAPYGRMSQPHFDKLERLVMVQAEKPDAGRRILLSSATLAKERHDWPEYQRRLAIAARKEPSDHGIRQLLMEANELVLGHGGTPLNTSRPALGVERLLWSFESLGGGRGVFWSPDAAGGCEFGFFQRRFGVESLSLLRWASIELPDLCRALDDDFAGLADGGDVELCEQPAYDWRAMERTYAIQFDHTHLDRSKVTIEKATTTVRMRFAFLRRKILDDLAAGEKVFVYRIANPVERSQIERLAASLNRHGRNRLLFVTHASDLDTEFAIDDVRDGLTIARVKPHPGTINQEGWLALCRSVRQAFPVAVASDSAAPKATGPVSYTLTPPGAPTQTFSVPVNTTAQAGFQLGGTSVIGTDLSSSAGSSAGPAIHFSVTQDHSKHAPFTRQHQFNTTLSPSSTTNNIWENLWSAVTLNGPGAAMAEINVAHAYFQNNEGATANGVECFEASMYNKGTIGAFADYIAYSNNAATGTARHIFGLTCGLTNANPAAGSVLEYCAINCVPMAGGGAVPPNYYCLKNSDPNMLVASTGRARFGSILNGPGVLNATGTGTGAFGYAMTLFDSSSVMRAFFTNQGALNIGSTINRMTAALVIGDSNDANTYGTHVAVQQTTAPTVTNGTVDAHASDVAGTITLSAANPVLAFHVGYASVPHVVISSPSGASFTYSVSTNAITFTGGAAGDTVTYIVVQ